MSDNGKPPLQSDTVSGNILWRWEGVFGDTLPSPNGVDVTLRYPGQTYDSETGLSYNWERYYDPTTGWFISANPVSVEEHVANAFTDLRSGAMTAHSSQAGHPI